MNDSQIDFQTIITKSKREIATLIRISIDNLSIGDPVLSSVYIHIRFMGLPFGYSRE